jgi:LysM repeat protein
MTRGAKNRYFDLSTVFALGLAALLLISMPGGCGDSDETDDEEDVQSEAVAEPTEPPMMEIVDPEPGDLQSAPEEPEEPAEPADDTETDEPANEEGSEEPANEGVYVVQEGDTLYAIAVQFGVSMDELMAENGMSDPNSLQVGQELQIP